MEEEEIIALMRAEKTQEVLDSLNEISDDFMLVPLLVRVILADEDIDLKRFCCEFLSTVCRKNGDKRIESGYICEVLPQLFQYFLSIDDEQLILSIYLSISCIVLLAEDNSVPFAIIADFVTSSESIMHQIMFAPYLVENGFDDLCFMTAIIENCFISNSSVIISQALSLIKSIYDMDGDMSSSIECAERYFSQYSDNGQIDLMTLFVRKFEEYNITFFDSEYIDFILSLLHVDSNDVKYISIRIITLMVNQYSYIPEAYITIIDQVITNCNALYDSSVDIFDMKFLECKDIFQNILSKLNLAEAEEFISICIEKLVSEGTEYALAMIILIADTSLECYSIEDKKHCLFNYIDEFVYKFIEEVLDLELPSINMLIHSFILDLTYSKETKYIDCGFLISFMISYISDDHRIINDSLIGIYNVISIMESTEEIFDEVYEFLFNLLTTEEIVFHHALIFEILTLLFKRSSLDHSIQFDALMQFIIENANIYNTTSFYESIGCFLLYSLSNQNYDENIILLAARSSGVCVSSENEHFINIGKEIFNLLVEFIHK